MEFSDHGRQTEDDDDMVTFELEAAEALAGLGRRSDSQPPQISLPSQDPAVAGQKCCGYTSSTVGKYDTTVHTAGYPSKGKSKQNSNEAEKEARKLRRILANRESARQTIRRRQAMHLELTSKAADLSEENQNLKKEKELAVAKYNSLKDKNTFLRTQMTKVKKAETESRQEDPKSSHGETSTPATNNPPLYLYNQPSVVPCFLSSVLPPSDLFPYHFACPDIMGSSQFLMRHMDTPPCSHRGQENPMGPVFVVPVPWMLPFLAQTTMFPTNDQSSNHTCSSSETLPHQHSDVALNQNLRTEASGSGRDVHGARFTCPQEANTASATEHTLNSLMFKKREPVMSTKKPEDVFAATEARRRRKELMKLKNTTHYHRHICKRICNSREFVILWSLRTAIYDCCINVMGIVLSRSTFSFGCLVVCTLHCIVV